MNNSKWKKNKQLNPIKESINKKNYLKSQNMTKNKLLSQVIKTFNNKIQMMIIT